MSSTRSLPKPLQGTAWKAEFADSVLRVLPDLNPDAADEASDEAFHRYGALPPESAALAWVTNFDKRAVAAISAWSQTRFVANDVALPLMA